MSPTTLGLAAMFAPLAAFIVALLAFRRKHAVAAGIVIFGGLVSAVATVVLLVQGPPPDPSIQTAWFTIASKPLEFGLLLDARSLVMGAIVGVIALCIQVYAYAYMDHDPGKGRFFAFLGLFEWAMLSFAYSPNLLQAFIFWELVGLASFLLIGFWYEKPPAVAAAKKAFIMTRIGDVGMFVGLLLLFSGTGGTLDITTIGTMFGAGIPAGMSSFQVDMIALLLFIGIMGKSAQFPLHTWLPDAMEGPTPVSALLHSATMVAAGVFLFARFHELFMLAAGTTTLVMGIGTFTALLSSTMAMVAKDIKKVLAYSSISQLGYMLVGLAGGSLFAGMFHLTTHAVFKALLFLCAGALIHHVGSNDMVAIGRAGGRKLRVTAIALVVGGAALAGVPLMSGFWSKEAILHAVHGHAAIYWGLVAAAFLTAYYTARMIFLVWRPDPNSQATEDEPAGAQHHGDDHDPKHHDVHDAQAAPLPMRLPILFLAVGAIAIGFVGDFFAGIFGAPDHHFDWSEAVVPMAVVGSAIALAWWEFGRKGSAQLGFITKVPFLHKLMVNRWYIDAFYKRVFVAGALAIAKGSYFAETKGFDAGGDAVAHGTYEAGAQVASAQNGRLQVYIGFAVALTGGLALYLALS